MNNTTEVEAATHFPLLNPDGLEIASELTSLTCITVLALALGAKSHGLNFKSLNYGRILVIVLYTLSWAFATFSVIIVSTNNSKVLLLAGDEMTSFSKALRL